MKENQRHFAVLIDADNAGPAVIEAVLEEVARHGIAHVKRIYGDWTDERLKNWKAPALNHSLQTRQQFAYTSGKNATDAALIIDAMDLLYAGNMDGFCIVSSDSDFTPLSSRLRESGKVVYGFGEKKTPDAFTSACDRFFFTENLHVHDTKDKGNKPPEIKKATGNSLKMDSRLMNHIRNAIEDSSGDDGWARLGQVGKIIQNSWSAFDPRNYGYITLSGLVGAIDLFAVELRNHADGGKRYYISIKRKKTA